MRMNHSPRESAQRLGGAVFRTAPIVADILTKLSITVERQVLEHLVLVREVVIDRSDANRRPLRNDFETGAFDAQGPLAFDRPPPTPSLEPRPSRASSSLPAPSHLPKALSEAVRPPPLSWPRQERLEHEPIPSEARSNGGRQSAKAKVAPHLQARCDGDGRCQGWLRRLAKPRCRQ